MGNVFCSSEFTCNAHYASHFNRVEVYFFASFWIEVSICFSTLEQLLFWSLLRLLIFLLNAKGLVICYLWILVFRCWFEIESPYLQLTFILHNLRKANRHEIFVPFLIVACCLLRFFVRRKIRFRKITMETNLYLHVAKGIRRSFDVFLALFLCMLMCFFPHSSFYKLTRFMDDICDYHDFNFSTCLSSKSSHLAPNLREGTY